MEKKLNKIKVIVPFYNPGDFLDNCILSLMTQDYLNYEVLFISDACTDGAYKKIPSVTYETNEDGTFIKNEKGEQIIKEIHPLLKKTKCKDVKLWRSSTRQTALPNIHNAMMQWATDPEDIVVLVDGDDYILGRGALSYINDLYNDHDCWVSWGESCWSNGMRSCSSAYSPEEYRHVRQAQFRVSHIRSYYAGLYHSIGKQDPDFNCHKEKDGTYYQKSYDTSIFLPMLELAPFEKALYNKKPLYFYNRENPINEDKNDGHVNLLKLQEDNNNNQAEQTRVHMEVAGKKSFKQIKDYRTGEIV